MRNFKILCAVLMVFCLVQKARSQSCVNPPSGLVSWWPGEGTVSDITGTNPGTLQNGVTFAPGKVGQAFSLDGVNDYVSIGDSPSLRPTNLTIEGWFNFSSTSTQILFAKTIGTGNWESYLIVYNGGLNAVQTVVGDISGVGPLLTFAWIPTLGTWYHIAYTFDDPSDAQALYIDGALVASGTTTKTIGYDSHPVTIGAEYESEVISFFFSGKADEIALYNRALSASEIQAIFAAGSAGKCKPIGFPALTAPGMVLLVGFLAAAAVWIIWRTKARPNKELVQEGLL